MPSREEIASWLRYAADEILNPYRPIPKETRIAIGVQQIIDEIRNHAIQVENMRCENCDLKGELLKEMAEALDKAIRSVSELIRYSHGVEGLHLNGDIAEWGSLRTGGNYEDWLIEFDEAASFLQKYKEQVGE